jgi:translation initiation factor IF-3
MIMAGTCVASTIGHSLFSVFVLPALVRTQIFNAGRLPSKLASLTRTNRHFSQTRIACVPRSPSDPKYKPPELRKPRNEDIRHRWVQIVNSEGRLDDPVRLQLALRNVDTKTHYIEQLTPDEPDNPDYLPVCRVVDKKQEYEVQKGRKLAAKAAKSRSLKTSVAGAKTIELNWAIDAHDLSHRMDKLKAFLLEGRRVEVAIAKKKRGRLATAEECQNVLRSLKECVDSVPGAREIVSEDADPALSQKLGAQRLMIFVGKQSLPQKSKPHSNQAAPSDLEEAKYQLESDAEGSGDGVSRSA